MHTLSICCLLGFLLLAGCSSNISIPQPSWSPAAVAAQAMNMGDTNKNGTLEAQELAQFPSLTAALTRMDTNQDQAITVAELTSRLESYVSDAASSQVSFAFMLNGQPLEGAQVELVPEPFFADGLKRISGTTGNFGSFQPTQEGLSAPGVYHGLYRLEVSLKDAAGNEQLPARYNTASTMGVEIAVDNPALEHTTQFELTTMP